MFNLPVYVLVLCTAYTAAFDECGKTDGITACGQPAIQGVTVACDDLPLELRWLLMDIHILYKTALVVIMVNQRLIYTCIKRRCLKVWQTDKNCRGER